MSTWLNIILAGQANSRIWYIFFLLWDAVLPMLCIVYFEANNWKFSLKVPIKLEVCQNGGIEKWITQKGKENGHKFDVVSLVLQNLPLISHA